MTSTASLLLVALGLGFVSGRTIDRIIEESLEIASIGTHGQASVTDGGHLVELDIRLTDEESDLAEQQDDSYRGRSERKAVSHGHLRWTDKNMPYTIGQGFGTSDIAVLRQSFAIWEEHTCVKFTPRQPVHWSYVKIEDGVGCNSHIGMIGGPQVLNLGRGCKVVPVTLHELGHALGLYHEQSRRDREHFVWVRTDKMDPNYRFASDKVRNFWDINNYSVSYDYASIMHYGMDAYSMTGEPTIITHDPSWQFRIGQAENLSFRDVHIVNAMYKCSDHCEPKTCPDGAFLNKHCECMCPGQPTRPCHETPVEVDVCVDRHPNCASWASSGECDRNPGYMRHNCYRSCQMCGLTCVDLSQGCFDLAYRGECKRDPGLMFKICKKSCGVCVDGVLSPDCADRNAACAYWASVGECNKNPNYMRVNCKRAGASC